MSPDQQSLDEVVIVGYGQNVRRNLTTAISSVKPSDIPDRNVASANQLLQGQVAGVNLTTSNGTLSGSSRVSIRGVSSINGDNEPLYVIDGIPLSKATASYNFSGEYRQYPLSMINPSDIESIDVLKDGLVHYTYEGRYQPYESSQRVDVLLVDLEKNELIFDDSSPNDSLSRRVDRYEGSLAAINGTYYEIVKTDQGDSLFSSFFKNDGEISTSVTVPEGHRLFWKHEGGFYYDAQTDQWGITYGGAETYDSMPYANAMSGSLMLIFDHDPVGARFVKPQSLALDSLDYEHPDQHQGVRHPRTALALTDENHLLMITIDGRRVETAGMSAKELTQFIEHYFKPRHALNIDGGGSTTMWIKDSDSPNGVVNYPTDNRQNNHYGQRSIRNGIIVVDR